jgi:hypothetical protein
MPDQAWIHRTLDLVQADLPVELRQLPNDSTPTDLHKSQPTLLRRWFDDHDQHRAYPEPSQASPIQLASTDWAPDVIWQIDPNRSNQATAPYGVWTYRFDDAFLINYDRAPIVASMLLANGTHLLGRAEARSHNSSPAISRQQIESASQHLVVDALNRILANGWSPESFLGHHPLLTTPIAPSFRPTNAQMIGYALRVLLPSWLRTRWTKNQRPQWTVGIAPRVSQDPIGSIRAVDAAWLAPLTGGFVADPFPWLHDSGMHVFVEQYSYTTLRGHIAVTRWSEADGFGPLEPVIVNDHHMSYPFLFEYAGRLFMLPEESATGDLWAYECQAFPLQWTKYQIVLEAVICADATLLEHQGRWWLFYTGVSGDASEDHLHICYSDSPFGPWTAHRLNPVSTGLRGSRMAGSFFTTQDGRLIRPAQDGSQLYGGALVFYEVQDLTPTSYGETELNAVNAADFPAPWNQRCHTYNTTADWVVFDALRITSA